MKYITPYYYKNNENGGNENRFYNCTYNFTPWAITTSIKFNVKRSRYNFEVIVGRNYYAINIEKNGKWMYRKHKVLINLIDVFRFLHIKSEIEPSIVGKMADSVASIIKEHPNFKTVSLSDTSLATFIQDAGKDHSAMFIRETTVDDQPKVETEETEHNSSSRHVLRLCEIKDSTRNLTTSINGVTKVSVSPKTISLINDVTMVKVPKLDKRVIYKLDVHHAHDTPEEEYLFYDFNGVMTRVTDLREHDRYSCETVVICVGDDNIELEYTVFIND